MAGACDPRPDARDDSDESERPESFDRGLHRGDAHAMEVGELSNGREALVRSQVASDDASAELVDDRVGQRDAGRRPELGSLVPLRVQHCCTVALSFLPVA